MPLRLSVELLTETYEAAVADDRPEWPPHPARAFCALVAQASTPAEWDALRWLESQGPPEVVASPAGSCLMRAYVPTNAIDRKGGKSTVFPGRTNVERWRARSTPETPYVSFVWKNAEPDHSQLESLENLARRLGYLGRPSGFVVARFRNDLEESIGGGDCYVPDSTGEYLLRVPFQGYADALVAAFGSEEPAHQVARSVPYRLVGQATEDSERLTMKGPYNRFYTLGFPPGSGIDGRNAVRVARALRDAVLSRLGNPGKGDPWRPFTPQELGAIHGHQPGLRPESRCALLALPFVGSPHATGELMGVGLAIGRDVGRDLRRALLQLLGLDGDAGPRLATLRLPGTSYPLALAWPDGRWSLEPSRWVRASRRWGSVLPVIPDRWPKQWAEMPERIAESFVVAGYPRPDEVQIRRGSWFHGAPFLRPEDRKRRSSEPDRLWAHVAVTFSEPLEGPVVVGHMRYSGLGLCAPLAEDG